MEARRGSVEGIMYLPYAEDDDEQQCLHVREGNDGDQAQGHRYNGADFFILFTYNIDADTLASTVNEIIKKKDTLIDAAL